MATRDEQRHKRKLGVPLAARRACQPCNQGVRLPAQGESDRLSPVPPLPRGSKNALRRCQVSRPQSQRYVRCQSPSPFERANSENI